MYTANKMPGKYEGNPSQLIAQILHSVVQNGGCDAQTGSVSRGGWFGLIVGTRNGWIVTEDNFGFFGYTHFDDPEKAIVAYYREVGILDD